MIHNKSPTHLRPSFIRKKDPFNDKIVLTQILTRTCAEVVYTRDCINI